VLDLASTLGPCAGDGSGGPCGKDCQTAGVEAVDDLAHGLLGEALLAGNGRGSFSSFSCEGLEDRASAQHKGIG
jgi:hypothetical protein